jgi:hypothetical protein
MSLRLDGIHDNPRTTGHYTAMVALTPPLKVGGSRHQMLGRGEWSVDEGAGRQALATATMQIPEVEAWRELEIHEVEARREL